MPEVLNLSEPDDSGDKPKKTASTPVASTAAAKAAAKKKLLDEPDPRLQLAKLVALIVVTIAALAFLGYHFFGPKEPESKDLSHATRPGSSAGRPGEPSVAPTGGPGMPRPGEGPAPAPRFNGIIPGAARTPAAPSEQPANEPGIR